MSQYADKNSERESIMRIRLKRIFTLKMLIVFGIPLISVIAAVAVYFFAFRTLPPAESTKTPQNVNSAEVVPPPRKISIKPKIKVITPVNVVDDAFRGYNLNKESDAEGLVVDEQKPLQADRSSEATGEELARQKPLAETSEKQTPVETKHEHLKDKEAKHEDKSDVVTPKSSGKGAGKNDLSDSSASQDEGVRMLNERLLQAGISEKEGQKMLQSYLELRKVLPDQEAQKMIMWKLRRKKP